MKGQISRICLPRKRYHQWDGKNTKDVKDYLTYIADDKRRSMVESVLEAFNENLRSVSFRTGVNHGDFNGM